MLNPTTLYNTEFIPSSKMIDTVPEDYHPSAEVIANSPWTWDKPPTMAERLEGLNHDIRVVQSYLSFLNFLF